jgi:hypothetical protein
MAHSLFSPSAAHRWINCPGSMSWPKNTDDMDSSSVYADDGTASHEWAALTLKANLASAHAFLGKKQTINGVEYECDEERADFIDIYVNKVRELAMGGVLFVEHWVDLSAIMGEGQGGTADAGIIIPRKRQVIVADLKYGVGERVDASYKDTAGKEHPNQQLGLYAAGMISDALLLGVEVTDVLLVIIQPRLGHISQAAFSVHEITDLALEAQEAVKRAGEALILPRKELAPYMQPGIKTCRWCKAQAECVALQKFVADEVRMEFSNIDEAHEPPVPETDDDLSAAGRALPLIMQWCKSVQAAIYERVSANAKIIGIDGQPLKFVEGEKGDRKWSDPEAAEAALVAVLGPEKAYAPRKCLTAPAAAKLLDKKATKQQWKDQFVPMITRAAGRAVLALGSDPRPAYSAAAGAHEFEKIDEDISA